MRTICLAVENAKHEKRIYPLVGTVTIGRNRDNTITLADRTVSRMHAKLSCTEGQWTVEDLGSANGVEHQGQRITEKRLNLGDSFEIGMSVFRLVEEEIAAGDIPKYENQLANSSGLVDTLECCFDAQGTFDRQVFLSKTAVLAPNHDRIFRLLLNYLKSSDSKKNRILLVNSIPALYDRVEGTRTVIKELLVEFCTPAEEINYHDRNVLMLASQLLRLYRKEDGLNIETTPEEVLRVQKGLCENTIELGRITVGELESELLKKLSTMHTALIDSLSKETCKTSTGSSPRFLFALLREFYILMALIGGPAAKAIVWQGALATSSANSRLYNQPLSKKFFDSILGLLRIVVRGCDRLVEENSEDIGNLKTLKQRIRLLIPSAPNERQQSSLQRLLDLLEKQF